MYVHEFQCPQCKGWFNRKWHNERPGKMWCSGCNVECEYDDTFTVTDQVMSRYDRQIIVLCSNTGDYGPVQKAGTALNNKAANMGLPSEIIELDLRATSIDSTIKARFAALTHKSRLYIIGHGHGEKIQGVLAGNLAYTVPHVWGISAVARIGLISCSAGESSPSVFGNNFARDFHSGLKRLRLATEVSAYMRPISVAPASFANQSDQPELEGKKVFYTLDDKLAWMRNDGNEVKIVWYWDDSMQQQSRRRSEDRQR